MTSLYEENGWYDFLKDDEEPTVQESLSPVKQERPPQEVEIDQEEVTLPQFETDSDHYITAMDQQVKLRGEPFEVEIEPDYDLSHLADLQYATPDNPSSAVVPPAENEPKQFVRDFENKESVQKAANIFFEYKLKPFYLLK